MQERKENTPTIPFLDKLAKFDTVSYCNQGKRINERKYGKGQYYNEYHNGDQKQLPEVVCNKRCS